MGLPVAPEPTPSVPVVQSMPVPTAVGHAECPICFEPLHAAPVGVFIDRAGNRVGQHFYNLEAARQWLSGGNGTDPLTRVPVNGVKPVPDIRTDPDGWFSAVDVNGDQRLSRVEAIECLKAMLPLDVAALDRAIHDANHPMWKQWDKDGSGFIERHELVQPNGLAAYVRDNFPRANERAPPSIQGDKRAWFMFWDEDHSGALEKEEVVRAVIKSLRLSTDQTRVQQMRQTIDAIWPIFDCDGSGSIEMGECTRPAEGLIDTIIASGGVG